MDRRWASVPNDLLDRNGRKHTIQDTNVCVVEAMPMPLFERDHSDFHQHAFTNVLRANDKADRSAGSLFDPADFPMDCVLRRIIVCVHLHFTS